MSIEEKISREGTNGYYSDSWEKNFIIYLYYRIFLWLTVIKESLGIFTQLKKLHYTIPHTEYFGS